ncbi:MAG: diacylglycerol kinase family protein [Pseudomonadota bacterium]
MPPIGHIRNPRATRSRPSSAAGEVISRAPDSFGALEDALSEMAEAGVERLVIDGGDGTIREVISRAPEIWETPPAYAIIRSGNTNLIARSVGASRDVAAATAAARATELRMLKVEREGEPPLRGFIMGVGAYERATRMAQQEMASKHGLQVVLTVLRAARDPALRDSGEIGLSLDGAASDERRMLVGLSTLPGKLIYCMEPFWGEAGGPIRWLDIAANPPRLGRALPFVAFGRPRRWMAEAYRSGSSQVVEIRSPNGFVLEGERFASGPEGRIRVTAAETATFLSV